MIIFAHLLNDRSGSPRVLRAAISALTHGQGYMRLFIGSDGAGVLNDAGIPLTRYWYWRTPYRLLTLLTYLCSQLALWLRLLLARGIDRDAVVYVNTLLPFGAALYGRMTGRPVVYHLHEVSVSPAPLRWFLLGMARLTAKRLIYVSDFHRQCLPIAGIVASTVYNALDANFMARAFQSVYKPRQGGCFRVLMLASLRDYKGVPEFLALAHSLAGQAHIQFDLVANDDEVAVSRYFVGKTVPSNVMVHPRTADPANHYTQASLVLNLSRPDQCVETFGLTLLEAMAFGVPVIAPPVGGPLELVSDGQEGFLVDCRLGDELAARVLQLAIDEGLCLRLSAAARQKASCFSPAAFERGLQEVVAQAAATGTGR